MMNLPILKELAHLLDVEASQNPKADAKQIAEERERALDLIAEQELSAA